MGATAPSKVVPEIRYDEKNHLFLPWEKQNVRSLQRQNEKKM